MKLAKILDYTLFRLQLESILEANDSHSNVYHEYIERAKELATTKWPKNNLRKVSFVYETPNTWVSHRAGYEINSYLGLLFPVKGDL